MVASIKRQPVPTLTAEGVRVLHEAYQTLYKQCLPASDEVIMMRMSLLKARYYSQELNQSLLDHLAREDIADARNYPAVFFVEACENWRKDANKRFAPNSVAQLMDSMQLQIHELLTRKKRVERLLDTSKDQHHAPTNRN